MSDIVPDTIVDTIANTAPVTDITDTTSNDLSVADSQPQFHLNSSETSSVCEIPSNNPSDSQHDNELDQHIQQCINHNQHHIDACCQSDEHHNTNDIPRFVRLQIDVESLIRKLSFYIVLFASFAFVIYEIIQLYVYTMPVECTIGILLCFAFVINFDIHRLQEGFSLPICSPLSALSSFIPLYKF